MSIDLKQAVVDRLVDDFGWDGHDARQAVEAARVCVDGVKPADFPRVLAQLLNDAAVEEDSQRGQLP